MAFLAQQVIWTCGSLTSISGVAFDFAWADRAEGDIAGVRVPVLGRRSFVLNKRATGRTNDVADLESLGEASRRCLAGTRLPS